MLKSSRFNIIATTASSPIDINPAYLGFPIELKNILFAADQTTTLEIDVVLIASAQTYRLPNPSDNMNRVGQKVEYNTLILPDEILRITVPSGDAGKIISIIVNYDLVTDNSN